MDPFTLGLCLTFFTTILLGLFVWHSQPGSPVHWSFAIYSLSIGFWALFSTIHSHLPDPAFALACAKVMHWGSILIPALFLQFLYFLTGRIPRPVLLTAYFLAAGFLAIHATEWFIAGVAPQVPFRHMMRPGPLYPLYTIYFFSSWTYGVAVLFRAVRESTGEKRRQLALLWWGSLIGYVGGSGAFAPVYNVQVPVVYPYGVFAIVIYVSIMTYGIVRHRLFDIEVLVRKTLVFAGLFGGVMMVVQLVAGLTRSFLGHYLGLDAAHAAALSVFFLILLYDPVRTALVNATDRYLFQKKESIKDVLNRLSQNMITVLDLERVIAAILATFEDSLRLRSAALFLKDENGKLFRFLGGFGLGAKPAPAAAEDLMVRYFEESEGLIDWEKALAGEVVPAPVRERLRALKAALGLPLQLHKELIGFLLLGKKKSDEEFSGEELEAMPTVAGQAAIALSNARLYDTLKKSQVDFAQQAKMAAVGTLSAGIGHEVKNPLNHMKLAVGMLRLNRKLGVYQPMTKEQFDNEVFGVLDAVDANVGRATEVVERLSSFAKKPREMAVGPVGLDAAVDNALRFLERDLAHDGITVKRHYAPDLAPVLADRHALEDIFLNLLVNARHAIREKGTITVSAEVREGEVEVAIADTGCGIPPENLERIFDPFFTTKDTSRSEQGSEIKGTGLGLFIVREVIKRHGGSIAVESEVGRGTVFRIRFPKIREGVAGGV